MKKKINWSISILLHCRGKLIIIVIPVFGVYINIRLSNLTKNESEI